MPEEVLREFKILRDQINDLNRKMDAYFTDKDLTNEANIEYVAMMTDVELPDPEDDLLNEED